MPRGHFDRTPRTAETRARLLEAAGRVLARRGYAGATLDEIAQEAGYTKGAVYSRFGSKEDLLFALLEDVLDEAIEETMEAYRQGRTLEERIQRGSDDWMRRLRERPERFQLFVELWLHAARDKALRKRFARHFRRMRDQFAGLGAAAAEELGVEPPEPGRAELVSTLIFALSDGVALVKLMDPAAVPDRLLGATLSLIVTSVFTSPEAGQALSPEGLEPPTG